MNKICQFDTTELNKVLNNLNEENRKTAIFKSLKKGGELLVEESQETMIRKMGSGATSKIRYKKSIIEGYGIKSDKDYLEVIVSATKFFLTRIFELGTKKNRVLKRSGAKDREAGKMSDRRYWKRKPNTDNWYHSGANRGKIEGKFAFKETKETKEQSIIDTILETLNNEIKKLIK